MASPVQRSITTIITVTGIKTLPVLTPKKECFIREIPWVSGAKLTTFCMAWGITSTGSVVPENTSMGKYSSDAMTPACLVFLATPPTSIPILSVDSMVSSQLPTNVRTLPWIRTFQNRPAAAARVRSEAAQYRM